MYGMNTEETSGIRNIWQSKGPTLLSSVIQHNSTTGPRRHNYNHGTYPPFYRVSYSRKTFPHIKRFLFKGMIDNTYDIYFPDVSL